MQTHLILVFKLGSNTWCLFLSPRHTPWCCLWLKRTLSTRPPTTRPPCGTVWHGLLLNPVPYSPSAMYDETPALPLSPFDPHILTYGTGSPWRGLCAGGAPWPSTEWLLSRTTAHLTAERSALHTKQGHCPCSPQNHLPPFPNWSRTKCPPETLKLISYINSNQDDSNDDDCGENNNAKVIIAVFILLNFYVLHSKGSWWTWKTDVLMMFHC